MSLMPAPTSLFFLDCSKRFDLSPLLLVCFCSGHKTVNTRLLQSFSKPNKGRNRIWRTSIGLQQRFHFILNFKPHCRIPGLRCRKTTKSRTQLLCLGTKTSLTDRRVIQGYFITSKKASKSYFIQPQRSLLRWAGVNNFTVARGNFVCWCDSLIGSTIRYGDGILMSVLFSCRRHVSWWGALGDQVQVAVLWAAVGRHVAARISGGAAAALAGHLGLLISLRLIAGCKAEETDRFEALWQSQTDE